MQEKNLKLNKKKIGPIPIIDLILKKLDLRTILLNEFANVKSSAKYVDAIEIMLKNILIEPSALYRIPEWQESFAVQQLPQTKMNDDFLGRTLDKMHDIDRATLQTKISLAAIREFKISLDQIHNDSTTVKFYGAYNDQVLHGVKLKRGHSKDHRPDLKQVLYNLSVTNDCSIPIHFKLHDGNVTDDTTHINNWSDIRRLINKSDFLYVADAKLCTEKNMLHIHREKGRFVTTIPKTRREVKDFYERCYVSDVSWELLTRRKTRKKKTENFIYVAEELFQLEEGFRIFWYRSSEKKRLDKESRDQRLLSAINKIEALGKEKKRGQKTKAALEKNIEEIIKKYKVQKLINVEIEEIETESYKKLTKGRPTGDDLYKKITAKEFSIKVNKNLNEISKQKARDGVFPLTTNTKLDAREVYEAYKYQPNIEKRFAFLKSDLLVSPVFLKNTARIDSLMFIYYLTLLVAGLAQRELKLAMDKNNLSDLALLPEGRKTSTPTWEQLNRIFSHVYNYELLECGIVVKRFSEDLNEIQKEIITLLDIKKLNFS